MCTVIGKLSIYFEYRHKKWIFICIKHKYTMPELKLNGDHFLGLGSAFLSVEDKEISLKDRGPRLTKVSL